jgi:hypothetical protein
LGEVFPDAVVAVLTAELVELLADDLLLDDDGCDDPVLLALLLLRPDTVVEVDG